MRYFPADVRHHHPSGRARNHYIYLARGEDRSGGHNQYAPVPAIEERTA